MKKKTRKEHLWILTYPIIKFVTANHSAQHTSSGQLKSLIRSITQTFIPLINRVNDNGKLSSSRMINNRCTHIFIPVFLRDLLASIERLYNSGFWSMMDRVLMLLRSFSSFFLRLVTQEYFSYTPVPLFILVFFHYPDRAWIFPKFCAPFNLMQISTWNFSIMKLWFDNSQYHSITKNWIVSLACSLGQKLVTFWPT